MNWFAKKVFDGGGNSLKNQVRSCGYPFKSLKNLKHLAKQFSEFLTPRCENKLLSRKGSILIEFAVCMPILIILLFYVHDLVKIRRYYSQTEFVIQQMANMIQNISQKRADKRITANDLRYIYCLALQTLYPADTLFYKSQGYTFGHFPYIALYYIKGIENGKASCSWRLGLWPDSPSTDPTKISCPRNIPPTKLSYSLITPSENVSPSNIYETLKINEGEEKIIIECLIFNYTVYKNLEGKYIPAKEALGLKLLSPKAIGGTGFLNSVVIFTPKPGLFSETAP